MSLIQPSYAQMQALIAALMRPAVPGTYSQMFDGGVTSAAIPAADLIYVYPFPVPAGVVSSIFANCQTTGATSAIKMAVWAQSSTTGRPDGLPVLGNNAGVSTASGLGSKSLAISNVTVTPGMYWFGTKATGTMPAMTSLSIVGNAQSASRIAAASSATAIANSSVQLVGYSVPDAYANDIMAFNMTGATFTAVQTSGIPVLGLGWA